MSNAVPHGWSVQLLGKLADVRSSNVDKKSDASELPVRLCNYTDVYYRNRITSDIDFMHATAKQGEIDRFALEKGDVIITKDSETPDDIAVPALVSESLPGVICGYHLTLLRPKPDRSNGEFLAHLFQLQSVQHYFYLLANGTTRFGLTAEAINTAPLITPPLPEQQKIATILSSVDDVIERTRAQIDKLKDLKTGMMQELLTKGIGHTEFKDSPVGRIPAEWELKTLAECCSLIRDGTHLPPKRVPDGIPLLSVRNIQNGKFSLLDDDTYVTRDFYEKMHAKWKPESGDLLLTVVGATVGKVAQVPKNFPIFTLQRSVAVLRGKENILDNDFLYEFSQSEMFNVELWDRVNQTAQPGIYLAEIGKIRAPMPPIEEQKIIAKRLQSVANNFAIKSQKLEFLINAKKALMQDLLTGKVRVNITDKESAVV